MYSVIIICVILDNMVHESSTAQEGGKLRMSVATSMPFKPESRVVGGQPAPIEKYPFAVQVAVNGIVYCGGTLITQKHVLSTAHCGFQYDIPVEFDRINLRVGSAIPLAGGIVYFVAEFIVHPLYSNPIERDNDIAIIVTKEMVALRDNTVTMARIAPRGYEPAEGTTVFYIGWGYLGNDLPQASSLQEVPVQVVNWNTCRANYVELGNIVGNDYAITGNMFCAGILGFGGRDACGGDSGGPVIEGGVVVGIISWGMLCAEKNYPGVNIKVSRYSDWIDKMVEQHPGMFSSSSEIKIPLVLNTIMFCFFVVINNKNY